MDRVIYCAVVATVLFILSLATGSLSLFVGACVASAAAVFFESSIPGGGQDGRS